MEREICVSLHLRGLIDEITRNGREKGAAMVAKLGKNSDFVQVNIDRVDSLEAALSGAVVILPSVILLSSIFISTLNQLVLHF